MSHHKYVVKLKSQLQWAYEKDEEVNAKDWKRQKWYYDRKIKCANLYVGDLVLICQKAFKGKHKISDRWKNEPYEIIDKLDGL